MVPVLEAIPNFSVGRDPALVERLVRAASDRGADVLDVSADPDHNRSVLTFVGSPEVVEEAAVAVADVAVRSVDLSRHRGVHPRIGALDVLPFVPLLGLGLADAAASARRVGARLAQEVGVPVYYYGDAAKPPGRRLSELRAGGFETLARGFPKDRLPDELPPEWPHPGVHPTAGATCVGARALLLAWNVEVDGLSESALNEVATELRERSGGAPGLRVLVLRLESKGRMQLSMNLEDVRNNKPFQVFQSLQARIVSRGGRVLGTEVIGLVPDELVFGAAVDRLSLLDPDPTRVLSSRLGAHVAGRVEREVEILLEAVRASRESAPTAILAAAERLGRNLGGHVL
jgi:glutamate formiminotransferase